MVRDAGTGGVTLKGRDVALKGRGVLSVLLGHAMGGQPGDSVPGCVLVFERHLELLEKVIPRSEGNSGAIDGIFSEGVSPGQGRPFGHVQEGEDDPLHVIVVRLLVDCQVELDGVHPGDSRFVGAIEGFGFAELKLSRFDSGRRHRRGNGWARIGER